MFSLAVRTRETSVRSVIQTVRNFLRLRRDFDLLGELAQALRPLQTSLAAVFVAIFSDAQWAALAQLLDRYFDGARDL